MKQVQEALAGIVPAYLGTWQAADGERVPPDQYAAYTTMTMERAHAGDVCTALTTRVYLNLWSVSDPTEKAAEIRQAMRAAGFAMTEERMEGADSELHRYEVVWTWVLQEDL